MRSKPDALFLKRQLFFYKVAKKRFYSGPKLEAFLLMGKKDIHLFQHDFLGEEPDLLNP
jgi:hypothetical protein